MYPTKTEKAPTILGDCHLHIHLPTHGKEGTQYSKEVAQLLLVVKCGKNVHRWLLYQVVSLGNLGGRRGGIPLTPLQKNCGVSEHSSSNPDAIRVSGKPSLSNILRSVRLGRDFIIHN